MYTYLQLYVFYSRSICTFREELTGKRALFSPRCRNQFVELFKIDQDSFIVIALCIQPNVRARTPARCLFAVIFHHSGNCYYAGMNKDGKCCHRFIICGDEDRKNLPVEMDCVPLCFDVP